MNQPKRPFASVACPVAPADGTGAPWRFNLKAKLFGYLSIVSQTPIPSSTQSQNRMIEKHKIIDVPIIHFEGHQKGCPAFHMWREYGNSAKNQCR
jgi:hypothetical protein